NSAVRSRRYRRLAFVRLIEGFKLGPAEDGRLIDERLRCATPEAVAYAAVGFDRVACRLRAAGRIGCAPSRSAGASRRVDAVRVRRRASGFAATDDRRHRAPEADRADAPKRIQVRPRCGPLAEEHIAEAALNTDRGVARR